MGAMEKDRTPFVLLCTVAGDLTAQVMKSHLESEGIPVLLRGEAIGRVWGLTVNGLGQIKVMVPADLLEEAERVIEPVNPEEPVT